MHEVGMMQSVLTSAIERAQQEGASHIRVVQMRVGAAAGVVPESLELAFEIVKKGTIAEDAHLEIDRVSTLCYCADCGLEFEPVNLLNECPHCHRSSTDLRHGQEFELEFLEVS
ncbi:MAG: hydrogenase maturation nickel metallochaperone HypA [Oscillatoriophycideae cyanobacterium NC_groundwater_1537_Pr4_S-0.65um_50_18]|nr:hydrogenase maturation nickel metallochaperone HypA [Oscillatoriophycideae cyanobacterium NC_groundwater_1537_Pr4_S-0.65um_50_18]